jgi:hypothetical protein
MGRFHVSAGKRAHTAWLALHCIMIVLLAMVCSGCGSVPQEEEPAPYSSGHDLPVVRSFEELKDAAGSARAIAASGVLEEWLLAIDEFPHCRELWLVSPEPFFQGGWGPYSADAVWEVITRSPRLETLFVMGIRGDVLGLLEKIEAQKQLRRVELRRVELVGVWFPGLNESAWFDDVDAVITLQRIAE